MQAFLRFIVPLSILFSCISLHAQISEVDYKLVYNSATCEHDVYIKVISGQTSTVQHRIQFGSTINFVVPDNSSFQITSLYNPKTQNGTGPASLWAMSSNCKTPSVMQHMDFYQVTNDISPTSYLPVMQAGDSVKLFSVLITPPNPADTDSIRLFDNTTDPPSYQTCSGSFQNGYVIFVNQCYRDNQAQIKSIPPTVVLDNATVLPNSIEINTTAIAGGVCSGSLSFDWVGPDNYTANTEDIIVTPTSPNSFGLYTLVVTDSLGYSDTLEVDVQGGSSNDAASFDNLRIESTSYESGITLFVDGDDNDNAIVSFEYRDLESSTYDLSSTVLRTMPADLINGVALGNNFFAGSIVNLAPNTRYALRVTLDDPDGSPIMIDTTFVTSSLQYENGGGSQLYVIPGAGGGNGSASNPYRGIQAALNVVQPGDVIILKNGTYPPFTIDMDGQQELPITIKSEVLHGAVIDGGNTNTGVITVGNFSDSTQHIIIDGLVITNGKWGVDAQNTQYVTVKNNHIYDVDYGFVNRRENGWEKDQQIYNNLIIGRTAWPQLNGEIPQERGVDLRGTNNEVSYNTISDFGDGISTEGLMDKVAFSLSIHHNDINRIVDDGIEVDGAVANVRVYKNRVYNARAGVSLSPIYGGPAYVFRNELVNFEFSALKFNNDSKGLVIVNNTIVNSGDGMASTAGWDNMIFCNNAVFSDDYVFEETAMSPTSIIEWSYNAYYSNRQGNAGNPWFKWNGVQHPELSDFQLATGYDMTSMVSAINDLEAVPIPLNWDVEAQSSIYNLLPSMTSSLVNVANTLPNLDGAYVTDGQPDIGAYERGEMVEHIGHDFTVPCYNSDLSTMTWNGTVNTNWFEPMNWTPCGIPTVITDVEIPNGPQQFPKVSTDVHINNMTIRSQAGLEILSNEVIFKLGNN